MTNEQFYQQHLELLSKNDPIEIVDKDYHDDAEMIVLSGPEPIVAKGKDAIRQLFTYYLGNVFRGIVSTEKLSITNDSIFLEATIDSTNGRTKVYDALYIKDGKIYRHYSGLK